MKNNLSITQKIRWIFIISIIFIIGINIFFYQIVQRSANGFKAYRSLARDANLTGRIQANILMMRLNVLIFFNTGNKKNIKNYYEYQKKLNSFMSQADTLMKKDKRLKDIHALDLVLKRYDQQFKDVQNICDKQNNIIHKKLYLLGENQFNLLSNIIKLSQENEAANIAYNISLCMKQLMQARVSALRFLENNEVKCAQNAQKLVKEFYNHLQDVDKYLTHSQTKKNMSQLKEKSAVYITHLESLISLTNKKKDLLNNMMQKGAAIAQYIKNIKLEIKKEQDVLGPKLQKANARVLKIVSVICLAAVFLVIFFALRFIKAINNTLCRIIYSLKNGSEQVNTAAQQISFRSQALAQSTGEQASGFEEALVSLEQIAATTKQNAANAKQADSLSDDTRKAAGNGHQSMKKMTSAIHEIERSSEETAKIIKVIDDIAFQTNLIALNAAVEAARAGQHGKGFGIVAEEVRNLAMRSAQAAKTTSNMIQASVKNAHNGVQITEEVSTTFNHIVKHVAKSSDLVQEIAVSSQDQSQNIYQIKIALAQLNGVTQQNLISAEQGASSSQELNAQAGRMTNMVSELTSLIGDIHIKNNTASKNINYYPLIKNEKTIQRSKFLS